MCRLCCSPFGPRKRRGVVIVLEQEVVLLLRQEVVLLLRQAALAVHLLHLLRRDRRAQFHPPRLLRLPVAVPAFVVGGTRLWRPGAVAVVRLAGCPLPSTPRDGRLVPPSESFLALALVGTPPIRCFPIRVRPIGD